MASHNEDGTGTPPPVVVPPGGIGYNAGHEVGYEKGYARGYDDAISDVDKGAFGDSGTTPQPDGIEFSDKARVLAVVLILTATSLFWLAVGMTIGVMVGG